MAKIEIQVFEGKTPRRFTKLTDESKSQKATNCDLRYGNLRPLKSVSESDDEIGGLLISDESGDISSFSDAGSSNTTVESTTHGLDGNEEIEILKTDNYDGFYTLVGEAAPTADEFEVSIAFTEDDAAGEWVKDYVMRVDSTGLLDATLITEAGGVLTITTAAAHGLAADEIVWFDGTTDAWDVYPDEYTVIATPTTTTFTCAGTDKTHTPNAADNWYQGERLATGEVEDIYLLNDSWLNFSTDTDVVESYTEQNDYLIYYTSATGIRQTNYAIGIVGESYTWPAEFYRLGVAKPISPLRVAVATDSDQATAVEVDQSNAYVYTYVTAQEEEGAESDASDFVDIEAGEKVTLASGGFLSPSGVGNNVSFVRIYKTVVGDAGTEYQQINRRGVFTSAVSDGSPEAVFTSAAHGIYATTEPTVLIIGSTSYNGTYTADYVDANTFNLRDSAGDLVAYSTADSTGEWIQTSDLPLADVQANGFIDRMNPSDAGTVLFTADFDEPPTDLEGLLLYTNNAYVGFSPDDNSIYFSEPNYPYAWPVENSIPCAHNIVGIGHHMESVIVCTDTIPYITVGSDPQSMILTPLPYKRKCLSKRGVVSSPIGVFYPTGDGLFHMTSSGGKLITDQLITREQWNEYDLTNMSSAYYDDRYYAFFDGSRSGFYIDLNEPLRIVDITLPAQLSFKNMYVDGQNLYILGENNYVYTWENHATDYLEFTWKSKKFQTTTEINFSCGRVIGDNSGTLELKFYVDEVLKSTKTLTSDSIFRLPSGFTGKEFELELTGTSHVDLMTIATSIENLLYDIEE